MTIIATTATITAAHVQAFLQFMSPSVGQVIELPNNRVLLHFTEDGTNLVAWMSQGASIHPMNVQTMKLTHLDAGELAIVKDKFKNPRTAKVLGYV
jgi:hypothetical protein